MILSSSEEEALNHGGMPGSPPDLSLTSSKSSKSSSYQSDDNSILADAAHFEDIGLGDDAGDREILDFVEELPNPYSATYTTDLRALKRPAPRSKPSPIMQRELTSVKTRPSFPSLRGHVRSVSGDVHGLGLKPATIMSRRGFTSPSTPTLAMTGRRNRSPSPVTSPMSPHTLSTPRFGSSSHIRRGSWQSNRERKTAEELERECDEEDGDDVPDDCLLENVPISPRPPHERALSMPVSPDQPKKEKLKPAGNGTPPIPIAHGSLKSPSSPAKPSMGHRGRSMGQFPIKYDGFARQPRVKSWTVALSELSEEAKALTEALEAHSDEKPLVMKVRSQSSHRKSSIEKQRVKSTMAELPPLRKSNIMIDPLPISKEKEAVLSRTRPSWLPPKDPSEEKRHLREYQRIMALSADADRKREAAGRARMVHKDDTASSLLRIWEEHVLPNWDMATSQKRTRELWWRGIAPRSRGTVWQRAIGNELGLSEASYHAALSRAKELEKKLASGHGNEEDKRKGEWFKTIRRSVCRTYSDLRIFQPGGPLYEVLVDVLMAYVVYRSDVGYVEGVNTTAALLLLNLPTPASTFSTLANLLNRPLPLSFHTSDGGAIARIHGLVLDTLASKYPQLYNHLCSRDSDIQFDKQPGFYLDSIFSALFTQTLHLDAVTRLWDVWVFEGDAVLVRAMIALMGCAESKLYGSRTPREVLSILTDNCEIGTEDAWMRAVRDAGREAHRPSSAAS